MDSHYMGRMQSLGMMLYPFDSKKNIRFKVSNFKQIKNAFVNFRKIGYHANLSEFLPMIPSRILILFRFFI